MNTNIKVIDLTRLEMKPKSTASEADALTTWSSDLLILLPHQAVEQLIRQKLRKQYNKFTNFIQKTIFTKKAMTISRLMSTTTDETAIAMMLVRPSPV